MTNTVMTGVPSADWSQTLLGPQEKWPWHWRGALTGAFDPGPGRRSGEGTLTIHPFLVKTRASQALPDEESPVR